MLGIRSAHAQANHQLVIGYMDTLDTPWFQLSHYMDMQHEIALGVEAAAIR